MKVDNPLMAAALAYASRGWPVFPCNPKSKKPLLAPDVDGAGKPIEGTGGVKKASTDPELIRFWWDRWPKALIALACGHDAGVLVLDFDAFKDAKTGEVVELRALIAAIESEIGCALPPTWVVDTPRGGQHWYFRLPPGLSLGNRGDLLGKGSHIDVRGVGGYVFVPPSRRSDGTPYAWTPGHGRPAGRDDMPAEAPAALIELIMRTGKWAPIAPTPAAPFERPARAERSNGGDPTRSNGDQVDAGDRAVEAYARAAFEREIRELSNAGRGSRNNSLNMAAIRLAELIAADVKAFDQAELHQKLEQAAAACGLVKEDGIVAVRKTIRSGLRKGLKQPRDLHEVRARAEDRARRYDGAPQWNDVGRAAAGRWDYGAGDGAAGDAAASSPPPDPPPPDFSDFETLPHGKPSRPGAGMRAGTRGAGGKRKPPPDDAERNASLNRQLAFFPTTDLGNAERFVERYRGRLLWCPALGWLWWDGQRWNRDGADEKVKIAEHDTVRAIQDEAAWLAESDKDIAVGTRGSGDAKETIMMSDRLAGWGRASEASNRLSPISKRAGPYLFVAPHDLDADPFKINCRNGTLIVHRAVGDGDPIEYREHDPDDRITKLIPVDYDREAQCPAYDAFLADVQPTEAIRRFLHAWGGLSLTGDVTEQRLVFCWGKGRNGKSTLLDVWAHVAGDYGKSVPVETFINEGRARNAGQATPDLAMLKGVRFVHTTEPEKGGKLSEGLVKLVTGGDEIPVRELNKPYFMLRPAFKLIMSGNFRPRIEGGDPSHGIWRRMTLVPWTVTISKDKVDKALPEKLRAEASGILNRLLDGLRDWRDHGLVLPAEVVEATEKYRSDSDPLGRFLEACTAPAEGSKVQSSELHELFKAWCKVAGEREWSSTGFGRAMIERGYERHKADVNWWRGIKVTKTVNDFVDHEGKPLRQGARKVEVEVDDDVVPV